MPDPAGTMGRRLAAFAEPLRDWGFVLKTLLALYLAAWLAMVLQLQQPSTSMLTVAIVMQPQSGMMLAKSFYRIVGTVVGSIVAVALIAGFAQQRELFLLGLSLWVSACAAGALLYRNFMSYGFVLAGYTAAIVALPVLGQPLQVFDSAQLRLSEVLVGIAVSMLVSGLLWPQRLRPMLRDATRRRFEQLMQLVHDGLSARLPAERVEQEHLHAVRAAVQLEDLRASVIFEDAEVRARSNRLRQINHQMMAVSTTFQSLLHLRQRVTGRTGAMIDQLCRHLATAMATPSRLDGPRCALATRAEELGERLSSPGERSEFAAAAGLVLRLGRELHATIATRRLLRAQRPATGEVERMHFQRAHDGANAWITALRTFATMSVLSWFWLGTQWPNGTTAMLQATVFTALMATAPKPVDMLNQTIAGFAVAAAQTVLAAVLLPGGGFAPLVAVTLPMLCVSLYLSTRPRWMGFGLGWSLGFLLNLQLRNPMQFSSVGLFNAALAEIAGLGAAALGFILLPARSAQGAALDKLRALVARAASGPLAGLAPRFQSEHSDLLTQLLRQAPEHGEQVRHILSWSLAAQETARALIELRQDVQSRALAPAALRACTQAIEGVALLYADPTPQQRVRALAALDQALSADLPAPVHAHLAQLGIALRDPDAPLPSPHVAPAAPVHAHAQ